MGKSLTEILGGRNMTGVVKTIQTGLPNYIPPAFFNVTRRVPGNKSTYIKVQGERANAKIVNYGSPAQRTTKRPLAETGVTLMHAFEEQNHDPLVLQNLLGVNGEPAQDFAIQEIDRQTLEFRQRIDNAVLSSVYSTLANGKIYLDGNGSILLSSSGAIVTIDFGVPAGNLNQIGGIIDASWGTATTNIVTHMQLIKKKAVQATGRDLKYALYGSNLLQYILTNNQSHDLITRTPMLAEKLYNTGEIPDGFMGLTWIPIYKAFGLNTSDAVTDWFIGDNLILTPEPDGNWWQFQEGSYLVPRNIGTAYADAMAAARDLDLVYGKFGYGTVSQNPPGITQYAGHTWMPLLASPNDLYIVDVTP